MHKSRVHAEIFFPAGGNLWFAMLEDHCSEALQGQGICLFIHSIWQNFVIDTVLILTESKILANSYPHL